MSTPTAFVDALKELLAAGNPGLATQQDLASLEERLDELEALLDELEKKLAARSSADQSSR